MIKPLQLGSEAGLASWYLVLPAASPPAHLLFGLREIELGRRAAR